MNETSFNPNQLTHGKPEHNPLLRTSGLGQQTGVAVPIRDNDTVTVDAIPEENWDQLERIFEFAPVESLPVRLDTVERKELETLTGTADLIGTLREHLLGLKTLTDASEWQESRDEIPIDPNELKELLRTRRSVADKYVSARARVELILEAMGKLPKSIRDEYSEVEERLKVWQSILDKILPNLLWVEPTDNKPMDSSLCDTDEAHHRRDKLVAAEKTRQSVPTSKKVKEAGLETEVDRLVALLSGSRAGQSMKKHAVRHLVRGRPKQAWRTEKNRKRREERLRERVLRIFLGRDGNPGTTSEARQTDIIKDLDNELWEMASVINDIRLIDRFRRDGVDLWKMKEDVADVFARAKAAEERHGKLDKETRDKLNEELVNILIPLGNATRRLFRVPNDPDIFTTDLSALLYREEAVCAGYSNVLTAMARVLGLKSEVTTVPRTMSSHAPWVLNGVNEDEQHTIASMRLLDGVSIVMDAAKENNPEAYSSYQQEANSRLKEAYTALHNLYSENAKYIPPASTILVYTYEPMNEAGVDDGRFIFNMVGASMEVQSMRATIPYPHPVVWTNAVPVHGRHLLDHPNKLLAFNRHGLALISGAAQDSKSLAQLKDWHDWMGLSRNPQGIRWGKLITQKESLLETEELPRQRRLQVIQEIDDLYRQALAAGFDAIGYQNNYAYYLLLHGTILGLSQRQIIAKVDELMEKATADSNKGSRAFAWVSTIYAMFNQELYLREGDQSRGRKALEL